MFLCNYNILLLGVYMHKKIIIVLFFVSIFLLCGCTDNNSLNSDISRIIGTWKADDEGNIGYYVFNKDKSGQIAVSSNRVNFTYEIKDDNITFNLYELGEIVVFEYLFIDDNNIQIVNLDNDKSGILTRVD